MPPTMSSRPDPHDRTEVSLQSLRRDRVIVWLWVPVGMLLVLVVTQAWLHVVGEPPRGLVTTLDVLWVVVMLMLIWRNSSRRCPTCDNRYLRTFPWMSLKKVKCGVCGYELK
jgi:hypothetical protein